jgi:quercetin dioxygenase-like cupin family protein
MSWAVRRLDDVPPVPRTDEGDPDWRPLQHFFGLTAFGANVFVARRGDETLVEEHDERASGQEELYLVLEGEVAFTLDGEELAATAGTVVAVPDPAVRREAVARTAGARILAVGAKPVGGFRSTWSPHWFEHVPQF